MPKYQEKTFKIPTLKGLSEKQIETHLKLYSGYVKHLNLLILKLEELKKDPEANSYPLSELERRFAFEFDGMRLHEYYFHCIEDGGRPMREDSRLGQKLIAEYGSFENWQNECIRISGTRGIGWTILYFDKSRDQFLMKWVDEHQIGHLAGLSIVLVVDVWEHAFMVDYLPSEKKQYVESYLGNINWEIVAEEFEKI